jgi:hypothetical protein
MKRTVLLVGVVTLALAVPLPAQLRIGLDQLAAKAKESTDITLDGAMLQMAGKFLAGKADDSKAKDLLSNLKAITVKTFEFAQEGQYRQEDLDPIRTQLQAPGWSKIISNHSEKESSEIYTKLDGNRVTGFAILAAEPKELTVVYIEGSIDLADLAQLGGRFGIPAGVIPGVKGKGPKPAPVIKDKDKTKGDQ